MRYCAHCILPDSRPGVVLDSSGVCQACLNQRVKETIDFEQREKQFNGIAEWAKKKESSYDCLIPVSGGKDSTWQTIKCLEYGLKPLCVTWRAPGRTKIGQENLDNLISLGVDHIDYSINPDIERAFMLKTLKNAGSPAIPMHFAIFAIPPRIALQFRIPLIIWGENSAFEYGSDDNALTGYSLDSKWLKKFGVTNGTTIDDWLDNHLTRKALSAYMMPDEQMLQQNQIRAIFLGHYFEWDVETTMQAALSRGFKRAEKPKTGIYDYADIDDDFISIHHFIKWYKFGMTRSFDNLSIEIRRGRLSREQAIDIIKSRGSETPHEDIAKFCEFVRISEAEFFEICERFRNTEIWKYQSEHWQIPGFIVAPEEWTWN